MKVCRGSSIVTPLSSQWRLVRARSSRSARASCQRSLTPAVSTGRRIDGADAVAHAAEHADDVGEVVLALGVVGREVAQRRAEQVATERVDAGADLVDGQLLERGVALLDDAQHTVGVGLAGAADDAAVAGGVVDHRREQRGGVAVGDVRGDEVVDGLRPQQRGVAGEDDARWSRRRGRRRGTPSRPTMRRVAGAALHVLLDEGDVGPVAAPAPAPSW